MLLCDFHREQAWERWLTKTANGCSDRKKHILPIIRKVARSKKAREMNEAITNLKNSEFWKIGKFQNYLMKYWLPLTEVSKIHMLLYGEMLIFYTF